MANQGNKDGWRTKGNKQLRTKEIVRACQLSKDLDSQGVPHEIIIRCSIMNRARLPIITAEKTRIANVRLCSRR